MRIVYTGVLLCVALCLSAAGCAAEEARTIVILDGTAQMSALLGQKRKLDWARSGISGAVSRMEPTNAFALWAFGTNPQKKCDDAAELAPLQPAGKVQSALDRALNDIQPKAARAPVIGALQAALKSLPPDGKPVSVVLIAGTGDDCVGDICSVAKQLQSAFPYVKLTVFGIGMSEQAAANFTCAAKALGGAFTAVKSGSDLDRSVRQALNATQTGSARPPVPTPQKVEKGTVEPGASDKGKVADVKPTPPEQPPEPAGEQAPPPPVQTDANVTLSAVLAPGETPLEQGVTWEIYKMHVTPTGQVRPVDDPLWVGGGGQAKVKLPEGRYSVRLTYGLATASGEFAVGSEKVEKAFPLNAGTIAVEAFQVPDGPPAASAFFILYKQRSAVAREELSRSSEVPAFFHVNAGDYALSALAGLAKLDASVHVEAGKVSAMRIALNVGTLEIKTSVKESPGDIQAWHQITPANPDPRKGGASILRVIGSTHRLQLPAGSYRIESFYGDAREESRVTVTAGQVTVQTVLLNVGEAKFSLGSGKPDRICAVYEAGADRKSDPVARGTGADLRFFLKAGRYDLECRAKGDAGPPKLTEISVEAGKVQSAKIED